MPDVRACELPLLPLVLWKVPVGLEAMLQQQGVPFVRVDLPAPFAFRAGRFVLFDSLASSTASPRPLLSPGHEMIDIASLRARCSGDPFRTWLDTRPARMRWMLEGLVVRERICRVDKAAIRARVLEALRTRILSAGGVWAYVAPFPYPYRSAFNLRVDLDEPIPDDYWAFARQRSPLADCTTHFVSTSAYGGIAPVLADLARYDTQSHGHYHVVYRDAGLNKRNLARARQILLDAGIEPAGFAAPGGRWNVGLDAALEELGHLYSSDFQVAYDDLPSFPWVGRRFSRVLQVPIHPVCEGIFLEAGAEDGCAAGRHLARTVARKIARGEPAFVYGHPERRLARQPEVVSAIVRSLEDAPLVWRTTLTAFARWWTWRIAQHVIISANSPGSITLRFAGRADRYAPALVIDRGGHTATLPVRGPEMHVTLDDLVFERTMARVDAASPRLDRRPMGWRHWARGALDWETVTPLEELPETTLAARAKKRLRAWRDRARAGREGRRS